MQQDAQRRANRTPTGPGNLTEARLCRRPVGVRLSAQLDACEAELMRNSTERINRRRAGTAPPAGGMVGHASTTKALAASTGKVHLDCALCGLGFERYACHVKRSNLTYPATCSRACAGPIRHMYNTEVTCVVCSRLMMVTPSQLGKKVTCGPICAAAKKRGPNPSLRGSATYLAAAELLRARQDHCSGCGMTGHPLFVRGLIATLDKHGIPVVDSSSARLICQTCHLAEQQPMAITARKTAAAMRRASNN